VIRGGVSITGSCDFGRRQRQWLLSRADRAVMTHKSNSRHREEESAAVVWVVRALGASEKAKRAVLLGLKGNWQE
jgi:hypothetical protein